MRAVRLPTALLVFPVFLSPIAAQAGEGPSLSAHVNGVRAERAESKALSIADLAVKVRIRGTLAETEITARFANPSGSTLEGDFAMALPKGSVVTGYALDIGGTMVDGVLESRYKAQEAYQTRVAVRVDPGLAEVDYSDRFTTRIFPILPGAGRTVRLRFVTPLDPRDGYVLPLGLDGTVGNLSLVVETAGTAQPPRISLPRGITARTENGGLTFTGEQVALDGALTIAPGEPAAAMTVSEHPGEGKFFELTGRQPALPPSGAPIRSAHVFWDRSVSRSDDALAAERALLGDWLRAKAIARVTVTLFDSAAPETRADLDPEAALALIAGQHYRGGTSYAALGDIRVDPGTACLLFSDGRNTIDRTDGLAMPCATRVVTSGPETDRAFLTELTGNAPIELDGANHAAALSLLMGEGSPVASLRDESGRAVEHVALEAAPGGWRVAGWLPASGTVVLTLASGKVLRFQADEGRVPVFSGPGALWASRRLAALGDDAGPDERIAFARRFSVANPQAAFVVLETPEDYARSEITPPASYPKDLFARYSAARDSQQKQKDDRQRQVLGQVRSGWAALVDWSNGKFDPNARPTRRQIEAAGGESDSGGIIVTSQRMEGSPRPRRERPSSASAPPPPSAPMAAVDVAVGVAPANEVADRAADTAVLAPAKPRGSISVEPWTADRPYVASLTKAGDRYEDEIDKQREKFGTIPLFWFDVAEWHFAQGRKSEAARAVVAALDLPTRDNQTLQIVASRLLRYGDYDRSIQLLERLALLETDRPQPRRTLALALIERAKFRSGEVRQADLERALGLLEEVIARDWPNQYVGIYNIALVEANRLIAQLGGREASRTKLDETLVKAIDAGVRVSAEWNTPRTDIDLWVREPGGEEVGYSHALSARGGRYNADMTQGYGPEEYMLRKPGAGSYEVRAKTFASDRNNPNGPSALTLRITYDFGRPSEREELVMVEMRPEDGDMRQIAKVQIERGQ